MSYQFLSFLTLLFRRPEGNAWDSATNSPILFYVFKDYVFQKNFWRQFLFSKNLNLKRRGKPVDKMYFCMTQLNQHWRLLHVHYFKKLSYTKNLLDFAEQDI